MDYVIQITGPKNLGILASELSYFPVAGMSLSSSKLTLHCSQELSVSQLEDIEAIVIAHNPVDAGAIIRQVVSNAIAFGTDLIIDFAAENVGMGITQAGKTKAVADYLADVMRYAQSGSLYEVLAEVNRLQAEGLPADLSPFITTERLSAFKSKIETYLGVS